MSDLRNAEAAERGAFLASELDRLLQTVSATAKAATQALDCVLQLHPSYTAPMEPPVAIPPENDLGRTLLEFCRDINAEPHCAGRKMARAAPGDGASPGPDAGEQLTHTRRIRLGQMRYVLFGVVLIDDHDGLLGNLTLAFTQDDWNSQPRRESCLTMGRNSETLLKTFGSKLALELDFLAVNKRVARLQRLAQMDPLSGLENSASFEEKVRNRLTRRSEPGAFILLDIDHFKSINDLYGHQFGDTYLKCISGAISTAFPSNSIVGRLGGDEFSIFADVPARGRGYLESLLSQCRSAIQRATALLGKPDLGRVSIGASFFPSQADDYETLYELSDTALYASKDSGRSITTLFDKEIHERYNNRELGKRFRTALAHRNIVPVFQPIVELATGFCAGYEVLSRWHDPVRGTLEPEQFAAVFTNHQLAERLTRTIMQQALEVFADTLGRARPGKGPEPTLAFNLTYFDLMNREFVFEVQNLLSDYGIDWSSIVVEVTETVMLGKRNGQVFRSLDELRMRGAKVALDDFATGYGGLRHLREWPIDILKIDKGFISHLGSDKRDHAIVQGIITIAATCGFEVVAEGIETPAQIRLLRDMECDFGQGYTFSRPLACDQLGYARTEYDLSSPSDETVLSAS